MVIVNKCPGGSRFINKIQPVSDRGLGITTYEEDLVSGGLDTQIFAVRHWKVCPEVSAIELEMYNDTL